MDIDLLSKMVKELILDRDEVALPGVGTFVAELVPSSFTDKGYTINPPYRRLYFRQRPNEGDTTLIDFYAQSNQIDTEQARIILTDFLSEMKDVLRQKKMIIFPGLGRLRATKENNFFFVADEDLDIYPAGFALEPISLKTHQETKEDVHSAVAALKSIITGEDETKPEPAPEPVPETPAVETAEDVVEQTVEEVVEETALKSTYTSPVITEVASVEQKPLETPDEVIPEIEEPIELLVDEAEVETPLPEQEPVAEQPKEEETEESAPEEATVEDEPKEEDAPEEEPHDEPSKDEESEEEEPEPEDDVVPAETKEEAEEDTPAPLAAKDHTSTGRPAPIRTHRYQSWHQWEKEKRERKRARRKKLIGNILLWTLIAILGIVLLFILLNWLAPHFIDTLLYNKEELELLNGRL